MAGFGPMYDLRTDDLNPELFRMFRDQLPDAGFIGTDDQIRLALTFIIENMPCPEECDEDGEVEESCDTCAGTGEIPGQCENCEGTGRVETDESAPNTEECPDCDGDGEAPDDCHDCDASGNQYVTCGTCEGKRSIKRER